jgi:probable rRNA maturation factor
MVTLTLSLQQPDGQHRALLTRARVRRWALAALNSDAALTVRIAGSDEALALNRDFRGRAYATNVLTFDYARAPQVVADIVLCADVVAREARELQRPLEAHYAHLVVHGVLHAQGMDHERAAQAKQMEARETAILQALGYANPYAIPTARVRRT